MSHNWTVIINDLHCYTDITADDEHQALIAATSMFMTQYYQEYETIGVSSVFIKKNKNTVTQIQQADLKKVMKAINNREDLYFLAEEIDRLTQAANI